MKHLLKVKKIHDTDLKNGFSMIYLLIALEKKYPKKHFYIFVADMIDINQFNNFSFIDAWINTACPRLEEDHILLNIKELK